MSAPLAGLHAGLIERARPRRNLPKGVVSMVAQRTDAVIGRTATLDRVAPVSALGLEGLSPMPGSSPLQRRRGLTLRVEHDLRQQLDAERTRSGRTIQSILHDALTRYLRRN